MDKTYAPYWNQELPNAKDGRLSAVALRAARKYIPDGRVYLYKFPNGKWSWASPNSPIAAQLEQDGHIYPTVPAARWWTVGR